MRKALFECDGFVAVRPMDCVEPEEIRLEERCPFIGAYNNFVLNKSNDVLENQT